jgi:5-formyltetrahydrofolate cyclo-ligase
MPDDPDVQKRVLRAELRERRQNMPAHERERATEGFTARLEELSVRPGPSRSRATSRCRPSPTPAVRELGGGPRHPRAVPRDPRGRPARLDVGEEEIETLGLHGVPEAVGELLGPMAINDVDLILVPAAAVDRTGMRLGWGRAIFDKTLGSMGKCPPVYAVVFDSEFVDAGAARGARPAVNGVVTPTRIIAF